MTDCDEMAARTVARLRRSRRHSTGVIWLLGVSAIANVAVMLTGAARWWNYVLAPMALAAIAMTELSYRQLARATDTLLLTIERRRMREGS